MNVTLTEILLATNIISLFIALIAFFVSAKCVKRIIKRQTPFNINTDDINTTLDFINKTLAKIKENDLVKSETENSLLKGYNQGVEETLAKLEIHYQPFINEEESWLVHKVTDGYYMQLYFRGLAIGERTQKIINSRRKVKQDEIDYIKKNVDKAIDIAVAIALKSGLTAKKIPR